jgi:hypothetical protein
MSNNFRKKPKNDPQKSPHEGLRILAYLIVKKALAGPKPNKNRA